MLFLDVTDTVGFGREAIVTDFTHVRLVTAAAVGSQMMFQCSEEFKIFSTILADSIRGGKRVIVAAFVQILIIADSTVDVVLTLATMLLCVNKKQSRA